MTKSEKTWLIGGGAVVGVGLLAALLWPKASSTPQGGGEGGGQPPPATGAVDIGSVNASLVANHRYDLTVTDPGTIQALQLAKADNTATVQQGFDRIFGSGKLVVVNVVSKVSSIDIIFDYRGSQTLAVNAATFQLPGGTLTDLGAAP